MNTNPKINRLSTILHHFCTLLIFSVPAAVLLFWINYEENLRSLSIARHRVLLDVQNIRSNQIILATVFSLLVAGVMVYGLVHLRKLFTLFKGGTYFSDATARHLHTFGLTLFISAMLKPVTSVVLSALLTMGNPKGEKSVVIEFGSVELFSIFIAGTFMAINWILREGQTLARENAEFV